MFGRHWPDAAPPKFCLERDRREFIPWTRRVRRGAAREGGKTLPVGKTLPAVLRAKPPVAAVKVFPTSVRDNLCALRHTKAFAENALRTFKASLPKPADTKTDP